MLPVLEIVAVVVTAHLVIVHRNNLLIVYYRIGDFSKFYGLPWCCLRFVQCILIFVIGLRSEKNVGKITRTEVRVDSRRVSSYHCCPMVSGFEGDFPLDSVNNIIASIIE
jgi:hypothetical protein